MKKLLLTASLALCLGTPMVGWTQPVAAEERAMDSDVDRELRKIEDERRRELAEVDAELERELAEAREEAGEEGKPGKFEEKAFQLTAKHDAKVVEIERKFAKKRAHVLEQGR